MTDRTKEASDKKAKMGGNYHRARPNSSIMQPIEFLVIDDDTLLDISSDMIKDDDVKLETHFHSLPLGLKGESFLLMDQEGNLKINSADEFIQHLDCPNDCKLKVISIVGNSGDGKSHTLNHLLFRGQEIFKTGKYADEGTRGVWAAYQPARRLLCLDTPPLHHSNSSILLMKIFAISDLVIYRTRSERLSEELFKFLGEASKVYTDIFQNVLQKTSQRTDLGSALSTQGPAILINHEPLHSFPLTINSDGQKPEEQIINKFKSMNLNTEGLGSLYYISTPPAHTSLISTSQLPNALNKYLENTAVRLARSPGAVLNALKSLTERFKSRLTCDVSCEACQSPCSLPMGHESDGLKHTSNEKCRYQRQFNNKELICRTCQQKVKWIEPTEESWLSIARPVWDSYELHCPKCGPIYKSKQYWFGNKSPEDTVVHTNYIHVWSGNEVCGRFSVGARRALEGVGNLVGTAYNLSADYIAPSYWQPNSEITNCVACKCKLNNSWGEIHHCRACGKGVCGKCSTHRAPVPKFGWNDPVRVCDICREMNGHAENSDDAVSVTPRRVTEVVANTLSPLSMVLSYPKGVLTELARPAYWIPDEEAPICAVCDFKFGTSSERSRHHCRQCGQSICTICSPYRQPVPERGWNSPVRVCKKCARNT
ncbi:zinc finger FYVE domain-containing protein 1-like isoform X2 [Arctopsyche grandis]|uniref:zinc finger FYVE domain-containing protein 1-like isoform X2 n=1 Tax=Arctopsyche grandis TaxID=121162 RepID=UPI00406D89AF